MTHSPNSIVISSRDVLDASPSLKVRVETVELPDGRRDPDYYRLEMPPFAGIFAETIDGRLHGVRPSRGPSPYLESVAIDFGQRKYVVILVIILVTLGIALMTTSNRRCRKEPL
jgi:hypothetical protein